MLSRLLSKRAPAADEPKAASTGSVIAGRFGKQLAPEGHTSISPYLAPHQHGADANGLRRLSWTKLSFVLLVIIPTLASAAYTLFWASYRYQSEFRVSIRSMQDMKSSGLAGLIGLSGVSQNSDDSYAVVQFLKSRDAIQKISATIPLEKIFSAGSIDWPSRLPKHTSIEKLTRYWDNRVNIDYEDSTGTIIVRVTAFNPHDAYEISKVLLTDSANFVNHLSAEARDEAVSFAEQEVAEAVTRLHTARENAQNLQNKERMLDPTLTAKANLELTAALQTEIAKRSAELATLQLSLSSDAPSVIAARQSIQGLQKELADVESRATATHAQQGPSGVDEAPLSSVMGAYEQERDEITFAEKAYMVALTSLETARVQAAQRDIYLATIVAPGLPQEPSFPKPIQEILTTFCVAGALWMIGMLGISSVREHMQ